MSRRYLAWQAAASCTFFQAIFFVYYAERAGLRSWWPPLAAWVLALVACVILNVVCGVEVFFLGLPGWIAAGTLFLGLSAMAQNRAREGGVS